MTTEKAAPTPKTDAFLVDGSFRKIDEWIDHARQLERESIRLAERLKIANEALSRIKWTKDCGIDGTNEAGEFVNFTAQERDAMYDIASAALLRSGEGE